MYQIVEYFNNNPRATAAEAISYFSQEMKIDEQIAYLQNEGRDVSRIRAQIRPLQGERRDVEEKSKYILSDIEMEVALKYPPRQGTDKEREQFRLQLKKDSDAFQELDARYKELSNQLTELEHQLDEVDRNAKNARRITELFQEFMRFAQAYRPVSGNTTF